MRALHGRDVAVLIDIGCLDAEERHIDCEDSSTDDSSHKVVTRTDMNTFLGTTAPLNSPRWSHIAAPNVL